MFEGLPAAEFDSYIARSRSDGEVLRGLWPFVRPHVDDIVGDFYRRILEHRLTAQIMDNDATVTRLKLTLKRWVAELLNGPWGDDYRARRRKIGIAHLRLGVDHATMFMARNAMQQRLLEIAADSEGGHIGANGSAIANACASPSR